MLNALNQIANRDLSKVSPDLLREGIAEIQDWRNAPERTMLERALSGSRIAVMERARREITVAPFISIRAL